MKNNTLILLLTISGMVVFPVYAGLACRAMRMARGFSCVPRASVPGLRSLNMPQASGMPTRLALPQLSPVVWNGSAMPRRSLMTEGFFLGSLYGIGSGLGSAAVCSVMAWRKSFQVTRLHNDYAQKTATKPQSDIDMQSAAEAENNFQEAANIRNKWARLGAYSLVAAAAFAIPTTLILLSDLIGSSFSKIDYTHTSS